MAKSPTIFDQIAIKVPSAQPTNLVGGDGTIHTSKSGNTLTISLQGTFNDINRDNQSSYTKICELPIGFRPITRGFYLDGYSFFTNVPYVLYISGTDILAKYKSDTDASSITKRNISIYRAITFVM